MRSACVAALALLFSPLAFSQTSDSNGSGVSPSVNTAPSASQAQPHLAQAPKPPVLQIWTPADSAPQAQPHAAQTPQTQQPPSYANYSIMLVNPAGGAVVLMHNPKNELEFVEVNNTKQALSAGYVPVRAAELGELISALKEENAQLTAENTRLQNEQVKQYAAKPTPSAPSRAELQAQQRAQIEAEKAARRQQMIQNWLMLQNMNRPQTLNLNVTDCTRFPALCAGR